MKLAWMLSIVLAAGCSQGKLVARVEVKPLTNDVTISITGEVP